MCPDASIARKGADRFGERYSSAQFLSTQKIFNNFDYMIQMQNS